MQHNESWSHQPETDIVHDTDYDNLQLLRLSDFLLTKQMNETEVAATVTNYEQSARNVRTRWELYRYADNYVNIEKTALAALNIPPAGSILDIGTADGKFLHDIAHEYGRTDVSLHGIELKSIQLDRSEYWERQRHDYFVTKGDGQKIEGHLYSGNGADLTNIKDEAFDAVSAMFMLYHLDATDRQKMLNECMRILKPSGRLVIATSGVNNKKLHRMHEQMIARYMSQTDTGKFEAPRPMNNDFVSETASLEVKQFNSVFDFEYHDHITLSSPETIKAYKQSLRSMYDQFHPRPPRALFERAVDALVRDIEHAAFDGKPYQETIQRQLLVCSKSTIRKATVPDGFTRLYFKAKPVL